MSAFAAVMITISSIRPANITRFNMASLHHWWPVLPRLPLKRCELRHSQSRPMKEVDKTGTGSVFAEKLRQLGNIRRNPSRFVLAE